MAALPPRFSTASIFLCRALDTRVDSEIDLMHVGFHLFAKLLIGRKMGPNKISRLTLYRCTDVREFILLFVACFEISV